MELGTYTKPLLDQAKDKLRMMEDPNLAALISQNTAMSELTEEEKASLSNFIRYLKKRQAPAAVLLSPATQRLKANEELVTRIANSSTSEFHRQLLMVQTEQERAKIILEAIGDNKYLVLEYMESHQSLPADFLKVLLSLGDSIPELTFTQLFVRACA